MNSEESVPSGVTVLVVDDEPRICDLFRKVLHAEGYQVITATSGQTALAMVSESNPQVILLDIAMPGLDGVSTLRELRRRGYPGMVIMLTAQGTVQTAREAMMLGAYDYITKPFRLEFVKSLVREGLKQKLERVSQ